MDVAEILSAWYRFAAGQAGFLGPRLQQHREQQGLTVEQQRQLLGIDELNFVRLQGMPWPRAACFEADVRRIAAVCRLAQPAALLAILQGAIGHAHIGGQLAGAGDSGCTQNNSP